MRLVFIMFLILNYTKKDIFPNLTRLPFGNLTPPWRLLLFLLWHCPPLFLGVVIKLALHLPSLFQSSRPCVSTLFIPCLGSLIQQSWFHTRHLHWRSLTLSWLLETQLISQDETVMVDVTWPKQSYHQENCFLVSLWLKNQDSKFWLQHYSHFASDVIY